MSALWIIFAGITWWLDGLLRAQLGNISPLTIVTIEHTIGGMILMLIGKRYFSWPRLSARAWWALIGVALFSGLIGTYSFTWAMGHVDYSSFTALFLILKLQPIFAILAGLIFLRERPEKYFYLLAFLALVASYFVSFWKNWLTVSWWSDVVRATLAGLIAAMCWGSATVFSRYLSQQGYKARTMTAYRLIMVGLLGWITMWIVSLMKFSLLAWINTMSLLTIAGIALLSWVLGTTMYYRGIKHVSAAQASIFELSLPITGVVMDIFMKNTLPDIWQIIGGISLVVIMTIIASRTSSRTTWPLL